MGEEKNEDKTGSGLAEVQFIGGMKSVSFDNEGAGKIVFEFSSRDSIKAARIAHMTGKPLLVTVAIIES